MNASRSRGKNPQNPDSAQSPRPNLDANSSSTGRSIDTSLGLGFQSIPAPPPPPVPLRRSLRISEASAHAQSPPPATHANPESAGPSTETSSRLGFQATSTPPPRGSASKRKRGRPPKVIKIGGNNGDESVARRKPGQPKRTEIPKEEEVVAVEEEEEIVGEELQSRVQVAPSGREKLIYRDKGKGKLVIDVDSEPVNISDSDKPIYRDNKGKGKLVIDADSEPVFNISDSSDSDELREMVQDFKLEVPMWAPHEDIIPVRVPTPRREAQRKLAMELAPEYARFKIEKEEEDDESLPDEPCPFSTAMKIIEEREARVRVVWKPNYGLIGKKKSNLLKELSLKALAENAEEIETLEGVPYTMRSKLSFMLCNTRKMNAHHLSQLIEGIPMELRLSDCSWATEKDFEDAFGKCDMSNLEVLQLERCGRCMPDYVVHATLARGPHTLPSLTHLSLKGAYSLSDEGLAAVISSAPLLSCLNLAQCSLLTSQGIIKMIEKRAPLLRELYIDECQNVSAMEILPSLKKVKRLEVLSMAGIESVSNQFVRELIPVCGSTIRELNFANCEVSVLSLLTSEGIIKMIEKRAPLLRELYIDECQNVSAMEILPSLKKVKRLEVLSMAGIESVSNEFVRELIPVCGSTIRELNFSGCEVSVLSLLTSEGIIKMIEKRAPLLRELYIDECQNVSAMEILPSLKKVKRLEVLSMAGIQSVSNEFVRELIPLCGSTIRELNFSGCKKLTSSSIKVIGENCAHLLSLDIRNLTQLKDSAIAHLANGCQAIQKLQLRKNSFSDEVIAAFVEASGTKLVELSLNNVTKVGHQTAIAISQRCNVRLQRLDLSFCRKMSHEALGLIVDSCNSLKTLKLFGCTQVTDVFLKGHSNASVRILGVNGNILDQIEIPDFV